MWKTVLFDLDGTLTDSAEGITKCVQYALVELGYEAPELSELNCFVGPPLHDMFMKYTGMDSETADRAVELYRERYVPTGMFENHLYPKIIELLKLLKKNGVVMGVASSKPEIYVKQVLDHFGISSYFKVVVGSELDGKRVEKKEVLEEAIRRLHMEKKKEQIVLVGDTAFDVIGANAVDIDCIAVTYGYGDRAEMEKVRPVYIAETVSDVLECVLSCDSKPKRETSIYQIWRILYPILIHISIVVLVSSMLGLTYIFYKLGTQGMFDASRIAIKLKEYNNYIMIASSALSVVVFGWLFSRDELKRKEVGIKNRLMHKENFGIWHKMSVAVFFVFCGVFLNQMMEWSQISKLFTFYEEIAETILNKKEMLVAFAATGVFAPIAEELLFRGLVYRRIRDYVDIKWGIVISSLLFGLYHANMIQFIYATIIGVLLALVYERYKTIWAPIIAHMAANIFICMVSFAGLPLLPGSTKKLMLLVAVEIVVIAVQAPVVLRKWVSKRHTALEDEEDTEYETDSLELENTEIVTYEGNSETKEVEETKTVNTAKKEPLSYRSVLDDYDDEELDRIIAAYEEKKAAMRKAEQEKAEHENVKQEIAEHEDSLEESLKETVDNSMEDESVN